MRGRARGASGGAAVLILVLGTAPVQAASVVYYHFTPDSPGGPYAEVVFPSPPASSETGWSVPLSFTTPPPVVSAELVSPRLGLILDTSGGGSLVQTATIISDTGGTLDSGEVGIVGFAAAPGGIRLDFGPNGFGWVQVLDAHGVLDGGNGTWTLGPMVPEPASLVLLGTGLAAVVALAWRRAVSFPGRGARPSPAHHVAHTMGREG